MLQRNVTKCYLLSVCVASFGNNVMELTVNNVAVNRLLELLIVLIIYALPILDILDCVHVGNPTIKC